jgi:hypothetical protein
MYTYHTERRSCSDGQWTVQGCKCSSGFLVLERHLTEIQPFLWSTTLNPTSVAFPLLLHTSLRYPIASPGHRQVKTTIMSTLVLP